MATVLDKTLKRELMIQGRPFTLSLSPTGFLLAVKGRRKGLEIAWSDLVSGEAALANALNASLSSNLQAPEPRQQPRPNSTRPRKGNGDVRSRKR